MTKRITLLTVLLTLFLFPLVAQEKYEKVIIDYLNNIVNKNFGSAYSLLCEDDKKAKSFDEFKAYYSVDISFEDTLLIYAKKINTKYEVVSCKPLKNNLYEVIVNHITPIYPLELKNAMVNDMMKLALVCESVEQIYPKFERTYKGINVPTENIYVTYKVVKEQDSYKVFQNFDAMEKIKFFYEKAVKFHNLNMTDKELDCYKTIYNLQNRTDIKRIIEKLEEQNSYRTLIEINNFQASLEDSFFGQKYAIVKFDVKNTGDKDITVLNLAINLLDHKDTAICQTSYLIVSNSLASYRKILHPGEVIQVGEDIALSDYAYKNWHERKGNVEILDVVFSE